MSPAAMGMKSEPAQPGLLSEVRLRAVEAARPREHSDADRSSAQRAWVRPLWIIALCCLGAALRFGREALIPLALGLLVTFILSGAVEALRRWHMPRALSAAMLLALLAGAVVGTADMIATPAQQWLQNAPKTLRVIEHKVRPAQSVLRRLDDIAKRATSLAEAATPEPGAPTAESPAVAGLSPLAFFAATGGVAIGLVTMMAFAFLLLAAGPTTLARMTCVLAHDWKAVHALQIIDGIRREVGKYYGTLLIINLIYGTVTAGAMWLLGMPSPLLWGVLAGTLNFVPYVGPALTLATLTLVALVTFPSNAHILAVSVTYLGLATIEGHIVEPVFLGRRLNLNPIIVLFALWIGGWLWGVAGVVLALPVLLAIKIATRMARAPAR